MEEVKKEEVKMSKGKKFGYFCLTWTPLLAYLGIILLVTIAGSFLLSLLATIKAMMSGVDMDNAMELAEYMMPEVMKHTMTISLIAGILGFICVSLWYYFGCKRKRLEPPRGVLHPINLGLIAALAFCMQYVVGYLLILLDKLLPKAMDSYEQMADMAGIGEVTVAAILYVGIVGPITEEFTCRGLSLYFAQKSTRRFWLANTLQALGFGILHLNLIQGLYAFVLGLLIGWLYNRFQSLYVACWFHIVFNMLSFGVLGYVDSMLPQDLLFQVIWAAIMFGGAVYCVWMLHHRGKSLTEGEVA